MNGLVIPNFKQVDLIHQMKTSEICYFILLAFHLMGSLKQNFKQAPMRIRKRLEAESLMVHSLVSPLTHRGEAGIPWKPVSRQTYTCIPLKCKLLVSCMPLATVKFHLMNSQFLEIDGCTCVSFRNYVT